MLSSSNLAGGARVRRHAVLLVALIAGAGLALLTGLALAKTFTINVAKSGKVTSSVTMQTVTEPIAVASNGRAVYTLSGDTIHHRKCTKANSCFTFWPPVTVSSAKPKPSSASGIKGKLGTMKLSAKSFQVTHNGHPLYNFSGDGKQKATATGEAIQGFGGTWHVVKASGATKGATTTGTTTAGTTTTTTTPTNPCYYPPC
jgi:predicted lipoprotein with Yx(FWY)xxD motif